MKMTPFVLCLSLSGCAAGITVDYARLGPPRDRPVRTGGEVAVLFREPTCSFEELGVLEIGPGAYATSLQEQMDTLRSEAGKRGANALLMLAHNDTSGDDHSRRGITRHSYTALAIEISRCDPPFAASK